MTRDKPTRQPRTPRLPLIAGLALAALASTAVNAFAACSDFNGYFLVNADGSSTGAGGTQITLSTGDTVTLTILTGSTPVYMVDDTTGINVINMFNSAGTHKYVVTEATNGHRFSVNPIPQSGAFRAEWSCTPAPKADAQGKPQQLIAQQSAARVQAIVTNQMGSSRQIDRLMDQGSGNGGNGGSPGGNLAPEAGFSADEKRALDVASSSATAPRLGLGMSGTSGVPLGAQLGLRSTYDDDITSPLRTRGPGYDGASNGGGANVAGLSLFGSDAGAFNFSTSLRDVTRAAEQQDAQRLKDDPDAAALGFTGARNRALDKRANPLDVWVEGRFMKLNDGRNGADLHGYSGLFGTGVDYVFNRRLLAGVSLSYDVGGSKSTTQGTEARGTGWLVGPYATVRLSDSIFWQSRAAWGRASTDVSPNATTTDSFGSTRWLASSRLTGRYQMGAWQLRPSAGVAYMEETSDSYTSSAGGVVTGVKTRIGTASAGPEISYQYRVSRDVLLEPRIGAEAIWTFARDISVGGDSALIGNEAIGPGGMRGRAELGLRTMIVGGTVVDLSGAYDGIGTANYNAITGRAAVRVPLN